MSKKSSSQKKPKPKIQSVKKLSSPITWEPKKVRLSDLKENAKNPKILDKKGLTRLQKTLAKFGLAGTIICNTDLSIIDGHARKKELLDKHIDKVWVSVPSRKLTVKEYKEFNAIFDLANAGNPDTMMIEEMFDDEFMKEWELSDDRKGSTDRLDKSDEITGRLCIEVTLENEKDQQVLYDKLISEGYQCRILNL